EQEQVDEGEGGRRVHVNGRPPALAGARSWAPLARRSVRPHSTHRGGKDGAKAATVTRCVSLSCFRPFRRGFAFEKSPFIRREDFACSNQPCQVTDVLRPCREEPHYTSRCGRLRPIA